MDFLRQFNDKCKDIYKVNDEEAVPIGLVREQERYKPKEPYVRYQIHKRSLPVGTDQIIMVGLTYDEALKWKAKLKPKLIQYQIDGPRVVHYYDIVREDGYKSGVYDNDTQLFL